MEGGKWEDKEKEQKNTTYTHPDILNSHKVIKSFSRQQLLLPES